MCSCTPFVFFYVFTGYTGLQVSNVLLKESTRWNKIHYSHVDLVDLVLQLFIRGELFKNLLFLVFALSVSVLIVAAQVAA